MLLGRVLRLEPTIADADDEIAQLLNAARLHVVIARAELSRQLFVARDVRTREDNRRQARHLGRFL